MKIIRYQSGGIYYTPFFGDEAQTSKSSSSSSSSEDKEEQMIKKEIISILKENGLQNDVDYFLSKARQLLNNSINLGFGDSSYDMGDITRLVSLANRTRRNFESYTNARDQIIKQGAGSDLAISNRGGLYVLDSEGELKTISPDSYYKNSDKYRPLTNTDLMQLRENDSNLAFNSSVLSDMSNAVGMQTIVDYIKSTINAFGTSKETKTGIRFTEKTRGKIEEGFQQILSGVSPDGIYKYSIKQSIEHQGYNDNTNEGLLEAVTYLYNTLAPNMKNVLRANCAAKGMDPNKAENVHSLLIMAIQEHTNHGVTIDEDITYDDTATKGKGGNGSTGTSGLIPESWGNSIQKNQGMPVEGSTVLRGGNIKFNLPGYHYGNVMDNNNKQVSNVTMGDETYNNLLSHGLVDTRRTAYFGDIPISNMAIVGQGVLVDNTRGGMVTYVPVDNTGNIDMDLFKQMTEIQEKIISERVLDPIQRQKIWESYGFVYDPQTGVGKPQGYQLARYWVQSAYTSTGADVFENKTLRNAMSIARADDDLIENLGLAYNADPSHSNRPKIDISAGWFGKSYEGLLFIPLNNNQIETLVAEGTGYIQKPNTDTTHAYQQAAYRSGAFNNGIPQWQLNGTTSNDLD